MYRNVSRHVCRKDVVTYVRALTISVFFYTLIKAISYAVGVVSRKRPFPTEAQIGLSYAIEQGLFRLNFFRLRISTGGSSRKTRLSRLHPPVKNLVEKVSHVLFEPITSPIPPPNTPPHGHTATHPYQVPTLQYHTRRRRWLGYPRCCFPQQVSVAHS